MPENMEGVLPKSLPEAPKPPAQLAGPPESAEKQILVPLGERPKKEAEEISKQVEETAKAVKLRAKKTSLEEAVDHYAEFIVRASQQISAAEKHQAHYLFKDKPISQELIRENPDAAWILYQIAQGSAADFSNPSWLLRKGLELQKLATVETQLKLHPYLQKILGKINEIWDNEPQKLQELKLHLGEIEDELGVDLTKLKDEFNRQRLADTLLEQLGQMPPAREEESWQLLGEEDERFADLPGKIKETIRAINNIAKHDPEALTEHLLEGARREIAGNEEIAEELREELIRRLAQIEPLRELRTKRREERSKRIIRAEEVGAVEEGHFEFSDRFSAEHVQLLKQGYEGEKAFFNYFIKKEEMKVREPIHFDLPDIYRLDEFWDYLTWKYGTEKGEQWEMIWQEESTKRKELHFFMIQLFYTVDEPKKILGALGRIRPEHLEYLTKENLCEYTIPMVEEEIKIMLGEKLAKWKEVDRTKEGRLIEIGDIERELAGRLSDEEKEAFNKRHSQLKEEERKKKLEEIVKQRRESLSTSRKEFLNKRLGQLREEQMVWDQGVWLTDADLQGDFEIFRKAMEKEARGEALNEEEQEWAKRGYASNLEWRVRKKLEEFLEKKGVDVDEWQIDKAVSLGMKFNIVTLRMPTLLAYWYIEPKTGKEAMRAPPFEDLVRILNPESFFFRFNMGGKLGEVTRSIYQAAVLKERAEEADIFITKLPEWNDPAWREGLEPDELKTIEENRHRLEMIEKHMGIPWTELLRGGITHIGSLFDATAWRGEIGIWDETIRAYSQMGKDHREFGLGFQLNLAGGEAAYEAEGWAIREADRRGLTGRKRQSVIQELKGKKAKELKKEKRTEIIKKIIRREPLLLAQLMANDKLELEQHFGDRVNWNKLETALQFAQMEMTTERMTEVELNDGRKIPVDFGNQDFFREFVADKYLELEAGESIDDYLEFIRRLQNRAKDKKEKLAAYPFPMTVSLTTIPWKDTHWIALGKIAFERRLARDVAAAIGARDATFKLWMNPSPRKWQETVETIIEGRNSVLNYADIHTAEEWAKFSTQRNINFNENKLRRLINWLPGLESGYRNLDGLFGTLRKLGVKGADAERAKRMLESFSLSVLFYGPDGNAWMERDIVAFTNLLRQEGAWTEHPEYAQEILEWAKSDWPWRLYAFARDTWLPALVLILAMIFQQIGEETRP